MNNLKVFSVIMFIIFAFACTFTVLLQAYCPEIGANSPLPWIGTYPLRTGFSFIETTAFIAALSTILFLIASILQWIKSWFNKHYTITKTLRK